MPRSTWYCSCNKNKSSAVAEMGDRLATIDIRQNVRGGCCAPFRERGAAGSPSNTISPGPRSTSIASGILIHPAVWPFGHNGHGPKIGACAPLLGGAGFPSNTMSLGLRPTSLPSGILILPFGHNRYAQKTGGFTPFWGRRISAGSQSNTVWSRPRPTCMPSFILIHPTIWSQYINVTDRQTGQTDNGLIA